MVVVEERGNPAGLRQALREEGDVSREGEGGTALALPLRKGAAREESILPKAPRRCLTLLGLLPP